MNRTVYILVVGRFDDLKIRNFYTFNTYEDAIETRNKMKHDDAYEDLEFFITPKIITL